jgi:Cu/Ag efflux pump CusA
VVVTGMLAATALAIFIIPLLFVLFERIAMRFGNNKHGRVSEGGL